MTSLTGSAGEDFASVFACARLSHGRNARHWPPKRWWWSARRGSRTSRGRSETPAFEASAETPIEAVTETADRTVMENVTAMSGIPAIRAFGSLAA